jgi:hypothetical protein
MQSIFAFSKANEGTHHTYMQDHVRVLSQSVCMASQTRCVYSVTISVTHNSPLSVQPEQFHCSAAAAARVSAHAGHAAAAAAAALLMEVVWTQMLLLLLLLAQALQRVLLLLVLGMVPA